MTGSGYDDPGRIIPGRAAGYDPGPGGTWRNAAYIDMSGPFAAGALYSTVDDMLTWDQALYAARPLKPESLKSMFTDYGHNYGFGFSIDKKWGQDRIWHNGGINGFTASFQRYPKARVTAVALANEQTGVTDKLAADLAGLCLGAEVYPHEVAETPAALARYAGDYEVSPLIVNRLEARGGALLSHMAGQPDVIFYPAGGGRFFARIAEIEMIFQTGSDGQVTGVLTKQSGQQALGKRISAAEAERLAQARAARMASHVASPGTEEALRRVIGELQRGEPDYTRMGPALAEASRQQAPALKGALAPLGAIKSVAFQSVGPAGADIFIVTFENGSMEWRIMLGEGGRIDILTLRPLS